MFIKYFLLIILPLCSFAQYEVVDVKFFEGGDPAPVEYSDLFENSFRRTDTRYIYTTVYLENQRYKNEDQTLDLEIRLFDPSNKIFSSLKVDQLLSKEHEYAFAYKGWGWAEAANWDLGIYRAEIWKDGKKLNESSFTINAEVAIDFVKFYNSNLGNVDDPEYSRVFETEHARKIYARVGFRNPYYNLKDYTYKLNLRYFTPAGYHNGNDHLAEIEYTVPKEWWLVELYNGIGYESSPGFWIQAGQWRVEVSSASDILAESYFTINNSGKAEREDKILSSQSDQNTKDLNKPAYLNKDAVQLPIKDLNGGTFCEQIDILIKDFENLLRNSTPRHADYNNLIDYPSRIRLPGASYSMVKPDINSFFAVFESASTDSLNNIYNELGSQLRLCKSLEAMSIEEEASIMKIADADSEYTILLKKESTYNGQKCVLLELSY